jgi:hypothetical protein
MWERGQVGSYSAREKSIPKEQFVFAPLPPPAKQNDTDGDHGDKMTKEPVILDIHSVLMINLAHIFNG